MSYRRGSGYGSGGGLPPWLVFIVAIALVFGTYYVWTGLRDFIRSGGLLYAWHKKALEWH